eukprot:5676540-Alexandrium_andersonii.AAC.1
MCFCDIESQFANGPRTVGGSRARLRANGLRTAREWLHFTAGRKCLSTMCRSTICVANGARIDRER